MLLSLIRGRHATLTGQGSTGIVVAILMIVTGCTGSAQPSVTATVPITLVFAAHGQPPAGATPRQVTALVRHAWVTTAAAKTAILTAQTTTHYNASDYTTGALSTTGMGPAVLPSAAADLQYQAIPAGAWRWRFIGDTVYAILPGPLDSGRAGWTRADLAHPDAGPGGVPPNPVNLLRYLSGSLTSVSATAAEVLDGTTVTRYDGNAELTAAAAAAPVGGARIALRHIQTATGSDHLFVQVWIDGTGRIRRLAYVDQSTATSTTVGSVAGVSPAAAVTFRSTSTTTLTLTDFGVPAAVTAPGLAQAPRS